MPRRSDLVRPSPGSLATLAALAASATLAASPVMPLPDLTLHRGQARVIVIDTPSPDDEAYRAQAVELLPEWSGLKERDVHIITRTEAAAFRFRLVGKDGEVKLDRARPVSTPELFGIIDAMPMRRAEAARASRAEPRSP
jgi:hypothetical protein